jgi:hypothetical protein
MAPNHTPATQNIVVFSDCATFAKFSSSRSFSCSWVCPSLFVFWRFFFVSRFGRDCELLTEEFFVFWDDF